MQKQAACTSSWPRQNSGETTPWPRETARLTRTGMWTRQMNGRSAVARAFFLHEGYSKSETVALKSTASRSFHNDKEERGRMENAGEAGCVFASRSGNGRIERWRSAICSLRSQRVDRAPRSGNGGDPENLHKYPPPNDQEQVR